MGSEQEAYDELCCYTIAHGGSEFIHQHVVDAFAAQRANQSTKPVALTFALVGLYLRVERHSSGRQVQLAHMILAKHMSVFPKLALPLDRGALHASHVMATSAGTERDTAIDAWCAAVWEAYNDCHSTIAELMKNHERQLGRVF